MNLTIVLTSSAHLGSYCVPGNISKALGDAVRKWEYELNELRNLNFSS